MGERCYKAMEKEKTFLLRPSKKKLGIQPLNHQMSAAFTICMITKSQILGLGRVLNLAQPPLTQAVGSGKWLQSKRYIRLPYTHVTKHR